MGRSKTCDGRCQRAIGKRCDCLCGGQFHGRVSTAEEFRARFGLADTSIHEVELREARQQSSLFQEEWA